jgi:2-oxoglutarate dehydrogenase E1 component
MMGT